MVRVVTSRATRVLGNSLARSTLVLQPTTYRGPLLALTMTVCVKGREAVRGGRYHIRVRPRCMRREAAWPGRWCQDRGEGSGGVAS